MQSYLYEAAQHGNTTMVTELIGAFIGHGIWPKLGTRTMWTVAEECPRGGLGTSANLAACSSEAQLPAPAGAPASLLTYTQGQCSVFGWKHCRIICGHCKQVHKHFNLVELAARSAKQQGREECLEAVVKALLAGHFDRESVLHNLLPALRALQQGTSRQHQLLLQLLLDMPLLAMEELKVSKDKFSGAAPESRWVQLLQPSAPACTAGCALKLCGEVWP
jgi:hypothetical protein